MFGEAEAGSFPELVQYCWVTKAYRDPPLLLHILQPEELLVLCAQQPVLAQLLQIASLFHLMTHTWPLGCWCTAFSQGESSPQLL